jgi:ABC-2 type transport system ATP-binding protein
VPVSGGAEVLIDGIRRLDTESIKVLDVGLRRPTLDDVFLSLTGHGTLNEQTSEEQAE